MELIIGINEIILLVLNLCAVQRKFWYAVKNNTRLHQSSNRDWMIRLLILHSSVIQSPPVCLELTSFMNDNLSIKLFHFTSIFLYTNKTSAEHVFQHYFLCIFFAFWPVIFTAFSVFYLVVDRIIILLRIVLSCTGIFESNKYLKLLADHSRNTDR